MAPGPLAQVLRQLPHFEDENLLTADIPFADAGVYRIGETCALVQSVDFFTPIVNDPVTYGRIAAANALSDIYAMGWPTDYGAEPDRFSEMPRAGCIGIDPDRRCREGY